MQEQPLFMFVYQVSDTSFSNGHDSCNKNHTEISQVFGNLISHGSKPAYDQEQTPFWLFIKRKEEDKGKTEASLEMGKVFELVLIVFCNLFGLGMCLIIF